MKPGKYFWLLLLIFLAVFALWWELPRLRLNLAVPPEYLRSATPIPDFMGWKVVKSQEIDADNDKRLDFRLVYFMKEREDAVLLFSPLDGSAPRLLILAHYPDNTPDIFGIYYGIYERGRWQKVYGFFDKRVDKELAELHIQISNVVLPGGFAIISGQFLLINKIFPNFNRRDKIPLPATNGDRGHEYFRL